MVDKCTGNDESGAVSSKILSHHGENLKKINRIFPYFSVLIEIFHNSGMIARSSYSSVNFHYET